MSTFLSRAIQRVTGRKDSDPHLDAIQGAIARIDAERVYVELGAYAREFMSTKYYSIFAERLQVKADSLHEALLAGKVRRDAYAAAYGILQDLTVLAPSAVERGRQAGKQLEAWREDGTLDEAELYRGHAQEQ